jgi:uncharacterized protein (DUF697 family)
VRDGAGGIDVVIPFANVICGGKEGVVSGLKFALEDGFEFGLALDGARGADEVVELIGIGFVVEEEPWAVKVADVSIAGGANAAKFAAALVASPFAKGRDACDKGCAV